MGSELHEVFMQTCFSVILDIHGELYGVAAWESSRAVDCNIFQDFAVNSRQRNRHFDLFLWQSRSIWTCIGTRESLAPKPEVFKHSVVPGLSGRMPIVLKWEIATSSTPPCTPVRWNDLGFDCLVPTLQRSQMHFLLTNIYELYIALLDHRPSSLCILSLPLSLWNQATHSSRSLGWRVDKKMCCAMLWPSVPLSFTAVIKASPAPNP